MRTITTTNSPSLSRRPRRIGAVSLAALALFVTGAGAAQAIIPGVVPGGRLVDVNHSETVGPLSATISADVTPNRACTSIVTCEGLMNACISAGLDFYVTHVNQIGQVIGGACVHRWD